MMPESADSMGKGTRIWLARFWPTGTGSLTVPGWNCQTPFRLSQFVRCICGRGYSAMTFVGFTCCAQSVMSGACLGCHCGPEDGAVTTMSMDWFGTFVTRYPAMPGESD